MAGGGDGIVGGRGRRDTLDLAEVAVIGQIAEQNKCTDQEEQAPHWETYPWLAKFCISTKFFALLVPDNFQ
jgi:hypothetical protein